MKTDKERRKESEAWNNWKPGGGRKGWSPFTKPIPPVRDGLTGHPLRNGKVDWEHVIQEVNNDA